MLCQYKLSTKHNVLNKKDNSNLQEEFRFKYSAFSQSYWKISCNICFPNSYHRVICTMYTAMSCNFYSMHSWRSGTRWGRVVQQPTRPCYWAVCTCSRGNFIIYKLKVILKCFSFLISNEIASSYRYTLSGSGIKSLCSRRWRHFCLLWTPRGRSCLSQTTSQSISATSPLIGQIEAFTTSWM